MLAPFLTLTEEETMRRLAAPDDPEAFARSKLDLSERDKNRELYDLHIDLLRLRTEDSRFRQQGSGGIDGAVLGPAMAFAVGAALPLTAAYLSGPFDSWARVALAVVAALSFVALRLRGDRLNGLRLSLGLAALALVVGVLWQ